MPRSRLDYYRVQAVANELVACGIVNPGVRQICEGLRARGMRHSAPSVYKHLLKWRSQRSGPAEPSAELVPSEPHAEPRGSVRITVRSLVSLQQEIVQLRTQAGHLSDAGEALEDRIDGLQGQITALGRERDSLSITYGVLNDAHERLRQEADCEREAAVQARVELALNHFAEEYYTRRLEMKQADIDRLDGMLSEQQKRAIVAEVHQARLEGTNRQLLAQLDESKRLEQAADLTCHKLQCRVDVSDEQLRSSAAQIDQLRELANVALDQVAYLRGQISELKRQRPEPTKLGEEVSADAASRKPN